MFESKDDNLTNLVNVRHILVSYEGGAYDETTGATTYSEKEKADAKALMDFHGHPEKMSFGQLTDIDDL